MPSVDRGRRALVAAILGGTAGVGFSSPVGPYLDRFAPLSGSVWESAGADRPDSVASPYGSAAVSYDEYGVPHVSANRETALYFAVGYLQGADRLFQLDLMRRVMRGELSAVVGPVALESDRFNVSMDFLGAAEATWGRIEETAAGPLISAFAEGVNAFRADGPLPVEFSLLEYDPDPWVPVDTMLMEKQIAWGLTGSFEPLRRATLREAIGRETVEELFPVRMDHQDTILGPDHRETPVRTDGARADFSALLDWVGSFERRPGVGSNSWVVAGTHTDSGKPILANDPHLDLRAPPVWYQQHLDGPGYRVRGVTFPGVPFVIIGQNEHGAWGFTNVGADVVDHYRYETDGDEYRYGDEWRTFDLQTSHVEVEGDSDAAVTVRKTVHGPVLSREGMEVAVAWTGLTATETTRAIYEMAKSEGVEDFDRAARRFDLPTQNVVYADREGNTYYHVVGRIPIRNAASGGSVEDESGVGGGESGARPVRGDRIFDGSDREGEWSGFEPYGTSSWEGFVPYEEKPGVLNAAVVATANQRVLDDPDHYIGTEFAPPFRGRRISERLQAGIESGSVDPRFVRDLQRDTLDHRATMMVPELDAIRDDLSQEARSLQETVDGWDRHMDADSRGALVFALFFEAYRSELFRAGFEAAGLDAEYHPNDWVAVTIDPGSPWFDRNETPGSKSDAMVAALEATGRELEEGDATVYGDINSLRIDHPFDQPFLNYARMPTDGSRATVRNYRRDTAVGSSWRMVVPMDGAASVVLPGGNTGNPFGDHYEDQLRRWSRGGYTRFSRDLGSDPDVVFVPEGGGTEK